MHVPLQQRPSSVAPIAAPARRLVIVDAHSHAVRAYHALDAMHAPDGQPTHAVFGLAGLLWRLVFEERPDLLAVVFDAPDDSRQTFRSTLYPAYKAHRPERPTDLASQMPLLRELTRAFGLVPLEHPAYEADDLAATLVAQAESLGVETTILSADKDLMQLVSERTTLWDTMRGRRYTPAAVEQKLGVGPALVADYLALVGDSSDNVPGVPGIGPRTASRLLKDHGPLDALLDKLEALPPRERKKLADCRELALLSRSLTRLDAAAPLPCPLGELALRAPDPRPLSALFSRLGFRSFPPISALPGPTLQGPTLQGPTLQGPTLQGPTLQGPTLPTVAPAPAPPPRRGPPAPARLPLATPRDLARLAQNLALDPRCELRDAGDDGTLELATANATFALSLRPPVLVQEPLFEGSATALSGPELARFLRRTLGETANAVLARVAGETRPALELLERWGYP